MSNNGEGIGGMLIFAVCFLGVFAILIAFIPSGFFEAQSDLTYNLPPDTWNGIDLSSFKETWNLTCGDSTSEYFDIGGRNLWLYIWDIDYIQLRHRYGFGLFWYEDMNWYNQNGVLRTFEWYGTKAGLTKEIMEEDYAEFGQLKYVVKASVGANFQVAGFVTWNTTAYDTVTEAFDADATNFLFGINFDEVNTSYNAWDLIAQLLFFQSPEVLGMTGIAATIINFVIATPLWICTAYIAYRLIILAIPLLGG